MLNFHSRWFYSSLCPKIFFHTRLNFRSNWAVWLQSNCNIFWSKIYQKWGKIHSGNCSWKPSNKIQQLLGETITFQPWMNSFYFVKILVFNEKGFFKSSWTTLFLSRAEILLKFCMFLDKEMTKAKKTHLKYILLK